MYSVRSAVRYTFHLSSERQIKRNATPVEMNIRTRVNLVLHIRTKHPGLANDLAKWKTTGTRDNTVTVTASVTESTVPPPEGERQGEFSQPTDVQTPTITVSDYHQAVEGVKGILEGTTAITLTTDSWTSICTQNYIAVTAHYISDDFQLGSCLLDCFQFTDRHTAVNLKKKRIVFTATMTALTTND